MRGQAWLAAPDGTRRACERMFAAYRRCVVLQGNWVPARPLC